MKGLILCGGLGTRLRPLTHTQAKHLLPVANKPILYYALEALVDAGIKDIAIIVGANRTELEAAVGNGKAFGARVSYLMQEKPLGLAHAVSLAKDFVGDDPFVVYLGDNLIGGGISDFVRDFRDCQCEAMTLLSHVKEPQRFGIAFLGDQNEVIRFIEKPKQPESDLAIVGVYAFTSRIFEKISQLKPSARGELELTDALQLLVEDPSTTVKAHILDRWWKDTGVPADILDANRILLRHLSTRLLGELDDNSQVIGEVQLGKGSKLINSELRGPVIIGENCLIQDSYIGPFTAIGNEVRLVGTELEYSIVLDQVEVDRPSVRIGKSILGRKVRIHRGKRVPYQYSLVLGEESELELP